MRKLMLALVIVAGAALPASAANAKVFCFNRITGAFINWGHCRPAHAVCNYYGPGGYCRKVIYRAFYY